MEVRNDDVHVAHLRWAVVFLKKFEKSKKFGEMLIMLDKSSRYIHMLYDMLKDNEGGMKLTIQYYLLCLHSFNCLC